MKIDWGASFFFSLMLLFYAMAFLKPVPVAQVVPSNRSVAAIEYRRNTGEFPVWIPGKPPEASVAD